MSGLIKPNLHTESYHPNEVCRIKDRYQAYLYVKHGARVQDIFVDSDDNLIMIFRKDETKELYETYRKYQLT